MTSVVTTSTPAGIRTSYPGQAPQIVENQVTYPLTTTMLSVPGAKTVRGYSFFGDSFVYVIFDEGTDLYWARSRVLEYRVSGVIQSLDVRSGMAMSAGQTLTKINGLDSVWLEAAVPEAQAGGIKVGSTIAAHLTANPSDTFNGKVIAILPDINMESRTLRVRIELPNRNGQLKQGMFAQVKLQTGNNQAQLLIPEEAVIRTGTRNVVILALEGGHFQPVQVDLGQAANGQIAILSGLQAGQKVVASGQFLIDSEASLQGVLAQMNSGKPTSTMMPASTASRYLGIGKVESITATDITISHHPIPAIGWGAMTMTFKLPDQKMATSVKVGDQVNFGFNQVKDDYVIAALTKTTNSPMQGNLP
ncbi:MAG: hypothetical protein NVS3B3_20020 [Aquirhabdus sp.]